MQYGCQRETRHFPGNYWAIVGRFPCRNQSHWAFAARVFGKCAHAPGAFNRYLRTQ
jgi:hypothetical protein